eukprot:scaffold2113_cov63-Attheya_sp.AAC.2
MEQLYDDGKRKNEVPLFYGGDAEAMILTRLRDEACDNWDTAKVGQANMIAACLSSSPHQPRLSRPTKRFKKITKTGNDARNRTWDHGRKHRDIDEAQKNYIETVKKLYTMTSRSSLAQEEKRVTRAVFLKVAMVVVPVEVLLQVEAMAIKAEDIANTMALNVEVHGLVQMTVAMKPRMIHVIITGMHTLGSRFTPRPHGATCCGCGGFRGRHGNGGDQNDTYQNDAASNIGSNNHASPSAASTVMNITTSRSGWVDRANASGWGSGNQSASNATVNNHWIDSVGAPE